MTLASHAENTVNNGVCAASGCAAITKSAILAKPKVVVFLWEKSAGFMG